MDIFLSSCWPRPSAPTQDDRGSFFLDLSETDWLFEGSGDLQFDTYRKMKTATRNKWDKVCMADVQPLNDARETPFTHVTAPAPLFVSTLVRPKDKCALAALPAGQAPQGEDVQRWVENQAREDDPQRAGGTGAPPQTLPLRCCPRARRAQASSGGCPCSGRERRLIRTKSRVLSIADNTTRDFGAITWHKWRERTEGSNTK